MVVINDAICGGRHEGYLDGCSENIKSKDIKSFEYACGEYLLFCEKKNDKLTVSCRGGYSNKRDGRYFVIKLEEKDFSLLKDLQKDIDKYNVTKNNGYCLTVDGLPSGIGDRIDVKYESDEKIYKTSNQGHTIGLDASNAFYEDFLKYVKKYNLDFNSKGSNVELYDDADAEYVQGTWKGKHFGCEITATFDKNHVTISVDDKVTDDNVEYIIYEGSIRKNELKEDKEKAESDYDYKEFEGLSCFKKKNWFTMTAYFMKDGYSTCDVMNFDKKKPEEEK